MERNAEIKFARELKRFYSLTFMSLVFSAIAMALSVALGVTNILTFINQRSLVYLIPACIGFLAFPFTIRWLLAGVEIMEGVEEIKDEYSKVKKSTNGEALTTLIVRTMAHYRAKKATISKLILLCKVAAICFIINGIFVLIQLALNIPADGLGLATSLVAALINLGIGAVGLYIPQSFQKYSSCWEARIQGSTLAEKELSSLMEGR
ncbi:MAG: hypothetical protein H5T34_05115 [Candidatus Methanomethyliales bacterium]|nr:hypothetical protein [Candidatus Methanomethylicales archaeon]